MKGQLATLRVNTMQRDGQTQGIQNVFGQVEISSDFVLNWLFSVYV